MTSDSNMERYKAVIDGVFTGGLPSGSDIVVGKTPSILQQYGAPDLNLHISQSTVRKIVYPEGYMGGKHNLGMSAMKNLPYQIADPIAILKSKSQQNSLVVITEWKTQDGQDVIVPIHLNKQGAVEVGNSIASAYGKGNIDALLGENDENILYTKNNEDIHQLLSNGLQLPEAMADDVLAKNTIPQNEESVKEQGAQSGAEIFAPEGGVENGAAQDQAAAAMDTSVDGFGRNTVGSVQRQAEEPPMLNANGKTAVQVAGKDSGLVVDDYVSSTLDAGTIDRIDNISKALGVRVRFVDSVREGTANAALSGSEILVEKDNENPILYLLGHEWTHRMQELAPAEYQAFRQAITDEIQDAALGAQTIYQRKGVSLSDDAALDEAAANYAGELLQDGKLLDQFIEKHRENRTLLEKLRDALRTLVRKLTGADKRLAQTAEGKLSAALEASAERVKDLQAHTGDVTMGQTRNSLKEDLEHGGAREESREDFYARWGKGSDSGFTVIERGSYACAYRGVAGVQKLAAGVRQSLQAWGIDAAVVDGVVYVNKNGITTKRAISEAATLDGMVFINNQTTIPPMDTVGHEAFHARKGTEARAAYVDTIRNNLNYGSGVFQEYQQKISDAYFGGEVDLTDTAQLRKFEEELFAYVSGHLNEGAYETELRSMFRDYDAVKAAWDQFVRENGSKPGYSLKGSEQAKEIGALMKENAALRERVDYWKGQTKRTERVTTDRNAVAKTARELAKSYGADVDVNEIAKELQDLYDYIASGFDGNDELTYEDSRERASSIAQKLVENAVAVDDETYRQYSDLREYLRTVRMTISEADSRNIADYGAWRRSYSNRLNLKKGGVTNIDQVYQELTQMWPEFFKNGPTHPADQLLRIADVLDGVSSVTEYNPYSMYMEQAVTGLTNEIMETFFDLPQTKKTFADRQAQKLDAAKAKGRQKVQEVREQSKQAVSDARLAGQMAQGRQDAAALRKANERTETARQKGAARLQEVREQSNARLEKLRQQNQQRVQKLRDEKNAKIKRIQDHYAEVRKNQAAQRADSEARNRLLNIARRLQNKKLLPAARGMLDEYIGDLDTVSRSLTGKSLRKLSDLSEWYHERLDNDPDFIRDERIEKDLERLNKRHIDDLTADEVADLTEVLLWAEHSIRTNQELIDAQDRRNVYIQGDAIIENVRNSKPWKSGIVSNMLSPERFARRITGYAEGDPLQSAFQDLSRGQREALDYQRKASQALEQWTGNKKFMRKLSGEKAERIEISGTDSQGNTVKAVITPAMRISLYLHSRNADNLWHIAEGGVTIPNERLYRKGKIGDAYTQGKTTLRLSQTNVQRITSRMTNQERAFANAIYKYFNTTSKEALNQTWEKLKGYDAFNVEDYFPINTDSKFTRADYESIKQDGTLTNPGYAKERVRAKNPILLRDANAVVEQSIRQHSKLVGLGIPVRNLNKLMNVTQTGYADSVMNAIGDTHGKRAVSYLEKLMTDVQEGSHTEPDDLGGWLAKARSKYAGAVLELNASVAIKQSASYPTSAAVLGWKPLAQAADGIIGKSKVDPKLVQIYTPDLWYRSLGFSSQELGDLQAQGKGLPKALNWIQGMDVATTTLLWRASEHYVNANFSGLEKGSSEQIQNGQSEYYKKVAEVYNRVIEETQPNYTVMQRPQILRSKNEMTKTLNMFKTQPFQNFNILYDSLNNLSAKRRAYSTSSTEETKKAYQTAKKTAACAITSQMVSSFVFAAMQFAWDAFRRKDDKYRDDEGDLTWASWWKGMGLNMATNALGMLPFGSEVYSLLGSLTDKVLESMDKDPFFDSTFYGFEVSVLETMNDTLDDSITGVIAGITAIQQAGDQEQDVDWEALARQLYDAAADYAQLNGLPVANVQKTFAAIAEQALVAAQGPYVGGYYADRITNQPGSSKWKTAGYEYLWKALKAGDMDAYDIIFADMQEYGVDGKTITSKMKSLYDAEVKAGADPGLSRWARDLIGVVDSYADAKEAASTFGADDLTATQYKSYNTERADNYRRIVDAIEDYQAFDGMDAEIKDKLLSAADSLTKETALANNSDGQYSVSTKWMIWAVGGSDYGVGMAEAILFKVAYDTAQSDKDENGKTITGSKKENVLETAKKWMPWLTEQELAYLESGYWTPADDELKELPSRDWSAVYELPYIVD